MCRPIQSVMILVITDQIGLHSVLLPLFILHYSVTSKSIYYINGVRTNYGKFSLYFSSPISNLE